MYYQKYIKYKSKYLHKKYLLKESTIYQDSNILVGGNTNPNFPSNKNFYDDLFTNTKHINELSAFNNFINFINEDSYLKHLLNQNDPKLVITKDNINIYKDKIYCMLVKSLENDVSEADYINCSLENIVPNHLTNMYVNWIINNY